MYYFIPAWYPQERKWYDNTEVWYYSQRIGFDDSINQLRMFEHAGVSATMIVLNYMPNLRYFTHRYDLMAIPRISLFDHIQGVSGDLVKKIDYRQLNWPETVDFAYSPFLVVARVGSEIIATIEFGEEGQLIWINYFLKGQQQYRYVFDDRGFVSSILYFQEGVVHHQDYLNEVGIWQIREYLGERQDVVVNPLVADRFRQTRYDCLDDLIQEQLELVLLREIRPNDVIILTADHRHQDVVLPVISHQKVVVSFFQNRFPLVPSASLNQLIHRADLLIADKLSTKDFLEAMTFRPVVHMSPFDTRLSLGRSQSLKELEVLLNIDGMSNSDRTLLVLHLFEAMRDNVWIRIKVMTKLSGEAKEQLKRWLGSLLDQQPEAYFSLMEDKEPTLFEWDASESVHELPRISFIEAYTEIDVMSQMETARLVIDLSEEPDLYTQIAAISSGVPQINRQQTEFVDHQKNGYIIENISQIREAIRYYLDGLANWNQALVYAVQKIEDYTSEQLVKKLQTKLESNE